MPTIGQSIDGPAFQHLHRQGEFSIYITEGIEHRTNVFSLKIFTENNNNFFISWSSNI